MDQSNRSIEVLGRDGLIGWINPQAQPKESPDLLVSLEDGRSLLVPANLILTQEDGTYYLPLSRAQLEHGQTDPVDASFDRPDQRESLMVIPVIAEQLEVGKRRAVTGRVQFKKRVNERQEVVDTERVREHVEVTRVAVNQAVNQPPGVRYEGDTMIIPVLEEVLVVEKRLVLREEVRVRKVRERVRVPQEVTLRAEQIDIERYPGGPKPQEE